MSFEFQSTLINLTPEFRISGEQVGGVRIFTASGGVLQSCPCNYHRRQRYSVRSDGQTLRGWRPRRDLRNSFQPNLAEIVEDELLLNPSAISSVKYTAEEIIINVEGDNRAWRFVPSADPEAPNSKEISDHTYELSVVRFALLTTAAGTFRESVDGTLEGLNTSIVTEIADRIAAITAEEQRVDALIASGMWLFADQAAFPDAATNHGRVVHSHADGAIFYAHGGMWHQVAKEVDLQSTISSVANEAAAREAADTTLQANIDAEAATRAADDTTEATARAGADSALSARLDTLEADPTTATAVAAGDAATLSSANGYTDTSITNLVNGADAALDTLKEIGDAFTR